MNFSIDKQEKYTLVKVAVDKLDTTVAPSLKSELVMLNAHGSKNLIIDLSATRYCDSSGLSVLLVANRLCKNVSGFFFLSGIQKSVEKLIQISQLDTVLNITSNVDEAVVFLSNLDASK